MLAQHQTAADTEKLKTTEETKTGHAISCLSSSLEKCQQGSPHNQDPSQRSQWWIKTTVHLTEKQHLNSVKVEVKNEVKRSHVLRLTSLEIWKIAKRLTEMLLQRLFTFLEARCVYLWLYYSNAFPVVLHKDTEIRFLECGLRRVLLYFITITYCFIC